MITTIKFLATDVAPKPDEVDYWVDITDNPYKGTIKYFNGTDWIRLQDLGGDLDLTKYYSKSEVNNLLNEKASVSSVESKLDDSEVASLIKNVQTDSTVDTLKLISTKYDGSTIVLNIPIADNGHTGVITSDKYKDLVTQSDKQALYIELYNVAEDIRSKYQKKLRAGKNIYISEDNVISCSYGDNDVLQLIQQLEERLVLERQRNDETYALKTELQALKDLIESGEIKGQDKHIILEESDYDALTSYEQDAIYMVYEPMEFILIDKPINLSFVYDGSIHKLQSTEGYSIIGNGGSDVGTYTFTVKLNFGYKWKDNTNNNLTITYTITPKPIIVQVWKFGGTFPISFNTNTWKFGNNFPINF